MGDGRACSLEEVREEGWATRPTAIRLASAQSVFGILHQKLRPECCSNSIIVTLKVFGWWSTLTGGRCGEGGGLTTGNEGQHGKLPRLKLSLQEYRH